MKKRSLLIGVVIAMAFAGVAKATSALLQNPTDWTTVTTWHYPPAPGADYIIKRQLGTTTDTPDDTIPVTLTDQNGNVIHTNSSPWTPIDVTQFGVPVDATVVQLSFKAIITAVDGDGPAVYAFVKSDGANICPGPPGFENYPVDYTWDGEPGDGGEKCWAVHAAIDGTNGVREFDTVDVPVVNGKFDFSWGYRKKPGQWPKGSAVAIGVWLDGWAN